MKLSAIFISMSQTMEHILFIFTQNLNKQDFSCFKMMYNKIWIWGFYYTHPCTCWLLHSEFDHIASLPQMFIALKTSTTTFVHYQHRVALICWHLWVSDLHTGPFYRTQDFICNKNSHLSISQKWSSWTIEDNIIDFPLHHSKIAI